MKSKTTLKPKQQHFPHQRGIHALLRHVVHFVFVSLVQETGSWKNYFTTSLCSINGRQNLFGKGYVLSAAGKVELRTPKALLKKNKICTNLWEWHLCSQSLIPSDDNGQVDMRRAFGKVAFCQHSVAAALTWLLHEVSKVLPASCLPRAATLSGCRNLVCKKCYFVNCS